MSKSIQHRLTVLRRQQVQARTGLARSSIYALIANAQFPTPIRLSANTVGWLEGKQQAFLRDTKAPGLRVRVTRAGAKSFVFEAKLNRKTIRRTIGDVRSWSIEQARTEARRLAVVLDEGNDPRELERQQQAVKESELLRQQAASIRVGDVWPLYLDQGRPKRKEAWKPRYLADLKSMAAPGGETKIRGQGTTRPGPLFPLLALPLSQVNEDTLKSWFDREAVAGRHQAARALMMFRGFLRWCASKPEYRAFTDRDAGRSPAILDELPSTATSKRTDALESAQVPGWWAGVEQLSNRTGSAYLRALLLTGARREEMAALKWADVDFQWRKLTIADKVDATRTIPLSPYMAHMLASLPRINAYVFASASKSGRIADVRAAHIKALTEAGIDHLTIHGLRRSFSLLGEASGAPAGAIAQVMGHKPSATAEGYRPRSVDALRPFVERIEAFILEQAGVRFDRAQEPGKLTLVA